VRLGVLDLGSNTIHLLLVDAHYGAAPTPASKLNMPLRLFEQLQPDGSIGDAAVQQLVEFVAEGQKLAEDKGATEIMAFATSAMRDAKNGDDVLLRIMEATGLAVEVLSGEDEARMTFLAVRRWFGWSSGRIVLLDIGGGSLEIASGTDEEPDVAVSLPLGAGRLTRDYSDGDPPSAAAIREMRKQARVTIAENVGRIRRVGEAQLAVATSKTFRQLARIAGAAPSSDGIHAKRSLKSTDITQIIQQLSSMSAAERRRIPGVSESRAEQLIAGAIVAEAAVDLLEIDELVLCPWALREGLILRRMDGLTP